MAQSSEPWAAPPRISWVARILGPVALIAVVIAFVVIVSGSKSGDSPSGGDNTTKTENKNKGDIPKTYTVTPGDSLTSIADQFGISIKRIERLNPDIDAQTLNEGQEIKLH